MSATSAPMRASAVRLEGHFDQPSRASWLIKWLLAIPHYLLLAFLGIGFTVSALCAFVVQLFGGRYPDALFEFNTGVMRWAWRVQFYTFGANGTDRYPPFTLRDVADYPARLHVTRPEHQRHGLPLVGWWLAGIPQYIAASVFIGWGGAAGWTASTHSWGGSTWVGLIDLFVLVASVVLLVRGEYPRSIFDLVLGLNRWVFRVAAYAAVMTPQYPPFRIDGGETEPETTPSSAAAGAASPATGDSPGGAPSVSARLSPSRIVGLAVAGLGMLVSVGLIAAGIAGIVLDQTQRDARGYLMTPGRAFSTFTYALVSASYRGGTANDWFVARDIVGRVRISIDSTTPTFIGIGREGPVDRYLGGVARSVGSRFDAPARDFHVRSGGPPAAPPSAEPSWAATSTGSGPHALTWMPRTGHWRVVLMNADGSRAVSADVRIGARLPHLLALAATVLGAGILLLGLSIAGVVVATRRRRRAP